MSEMTDPMEALTSLQIEVKRGLRFKPCELDSSIGVYMDQPNGSTRLSYAKIEDGIVKALSLFVAVDPIDGVACFTAGYSVANDCRNNGIATSFLKNSIAELKHGLGENGVNKFYIEAIVGVDNIASQKVAAKTISTTHEAVVDCCSGKGAFRYLHLVET